jgi:hypothetical protein
MMNYEGTTKLKKEYLIRTFFCLDTKESTKEKIKALEKTPKSRFAKLGGEKQLTACGVSDRFFADVLRREHGFPAPARFLFFKL